MERKRPNYPIEPWSVTETAFRAADNYRNETVFALSNGYIGTRGTFEEGYDFEADQGLEGNFVNGFYESEPIRYGERNFGFPEHSQTLLNLPNLKTTQVYVDGERFDMRAGLVENYRRALDLRAGLVTRSLDWTSPGGRRVRFETARFVSFAMKHVMAQRIRVTPLDDFAGEIRLVSVLDADVENHTGVTNPLIDYGPFGRTLHPGEIAAADGMLLYTGHTTNSGLHMACGSLHKLAGVAGGAIYATDGADATGGTGGADATGGTGGTDGTGGTGGIDEVDEAYGVDGVYEIGELRCSVTYTARRAVTLDKFIAYSTSLDKPAVDNKPQGGMPWGGMPWGEWGGGSIPEILREAAREGFDALAQRQRAYTRSFWECADIEITGDDCIQQGLRFNLFHIMQSAGRDGRAGMGAKGLSGEGYEGHYFWDTEIYVLPVLIHTFPDAARSLLDYRYATLDAARARARVLGHGQGALYPWRTINGEECSTYVPLGTAQYHINADIAYAFAQYVEATGDMAYLKAKAAEVLCETARVWADVGCFSEARGGQYCICCVTGPDEYTAFVDNNAYTNLMARENLRDAASAVRWLAENDGVALDALREKIGLRPDEPGLWQNIADNMYLPRDEAMGVYWPDDGFPLRQPWDDARVPPEKRHLLYENYHPLFIWRQRMAKQADTILAMFLHSDRFDRDEMARNYDFYQGFTLHHSSLSTCVFGMVASAIGRDDEAYRYFSASARMDLDDHHNNVYAGIHAANMAGTWQAVVFGFAGLRTNAGRLELWPSLPVRWTGYRFRAVYRGRPLEVSVRAGVCSVTLLDRGGAPLDITLYGEGHRLEGGQSICGNIR